MKAWNSSGSTAGIRAVLAALALIVTIYPAARTALGSTGHPLTPQTAEEKPLRRVELLVLEDGLKEVTVGLHVELAAGWYLYWLNPGDAGLAPEVRWQLPAGYEAGKLRFPTPRKFLHGDIVTYGFTDEVLLLCDIRQPETPSKADRPTFTAELDWMACRESCITGKSTAQVNLSGLSPADQQKSRSIFARFSPRFPKSPNPADLTVEQARLSKTSGGWTVEIALSGRDAARISDFYPHPFDDFVIDHRRVKVSGGKIAIPMEPANPSAVLSVVGGLLIIGGTGYEFSIPIKE